METRMPRKSAEDRAAAAWRAGGKHPEPPKHLSRRAKAMWREIVASRPPDYFAPGAAHLLESFVVAVLAARTLAEVVEANPRDEAAAKEWRDFAKVEATLATKLRLAVSSAIRPQSGKLTEKGGSHPLIGGSA